MRSRDLVAVVLLVAALAFFVWSARAQTPAASVDEQDLHEIAARLRCVVCQNLSVADSPSEMATQMRGVIRERLAAGDRPEQVVQYFVDKYGEWILLSPRRQGFTLLVWVVPAVAALGGVVLAGWLIVRWSRRREPRPSPPGPAVDPAMSERIRREMESS
ncbi:MAG: cytochrome c-type biogenesis protein CcmH [Candidatus Rokubacteria bacterium]|nr:cytochrome c-type biogenesis protein CcmH [Candidatus Rokubacteria bacterium]MBI3826205.1 cytochrome c-type biogenesis protein CcmH [Candidatus Rokubacteria bacterium]